MHFLRQKPGHSESIRRNFRGIPANDEDEGLGLGVQMPQETGQTRAAHELQTLLAAPAGFSEDGDPASTHWMRHFYTGLRCIRLVSGGLQSISIHERGGFISAFAPTHSLARRFGMFPDKACIATFSSHK